MPAKSIAVLPMRALFMPMRARFCLDELIAIGLCIDRTSTACIRCSLLVAVRRRGCMHAFASQAGRCALRTSRRASPIGRRACGMRTPSRSRLRGRLACFPRARSVQQCMRSTESKRGGVCRLARHLRAVLRAADRGFGGERCVREPMETGVARDERLLQIDAAGEQAC
jgi:hypothetical protein